MRISVVLSVFIVCSLYAIVRAQSQSCTADPCFPEFSSGLDSLMLRLDSDVASMMSAYSQSQPIEQNLQKCTGITGTPTVRPVTSSWKSSYQSGIPISTVSASYPSWEPLSTPATKDPNPEPNTRTTFGPIVATTESSSMSTGTIIAIVVPVVIGALAVIGLSLWYFSNKFPTKTYVPNRSTPGVWKYPPIQERNPVMYENRYFQPNVYN